MNKQMLVLLGLLLLLLAACGKQTQEPGQTEAGVVVCGIPWEQVETITITRSTEGGTESAALTQQQDIQLVMGMLGNVTVGAENSMAVSDDDLRVDISASGQSCTLTFEGSSILLDGKRYEVQNLSPLKRYAENLLGR